MSAYADAQAAYTTQSILTAPPERLVVMLYDSAIRFLAQAAVAVEGDDVELAHAKLKRVDAIIDELNFSLDMSYGELPERLRSIYLFCKRHILQAMLHRDAAALRTVAGLLAELRQAWEQVANGEAPGLQAGAAA
jgi:flagellar protein FliS